MTTSCCLHLLTPSPTDVCSRVCNQFTVLTLARLWIMGKIGQTNVLLSPLVTIFPLVPKSFSHLSCCPKKRASTCASFSRSAFAGQKGKPFSLAQTSGWGWLYKRWSKMTQCIEWSNIFPTIYIKTGRRTYTWLTKPVVPFLAWRQVALRTHLNLIHLQERVTKI